MLVLITYDVSTTSKSGQKRLRKLAKECVNYGQRVQNSVFECEVDMTTWRRVKHILESIIDPKHDSLRYYYLGKKGNTKIEYYGVKSGYDMTGTLVF